MRFPLGAPASQLGMLAPETWCVNQEAIPRRHTRRLRHRASSLRGRCPGPARFHTPGGSQARCLLASAACQTLDDLEDVGEARRAERVHELESRLETCA